MSPARLKPIYSDNAPNSVAAQIDRTIRLLIRPIDLLASKDGGENLHLTDLRRLYLEKIAIQDHHVGMLSDLDRSGDVLMQALSD